jgi:hypothetical protein
LPSPSRHQPSANYRIDQHGLAVIPAPRPFATASACCSSGPANGPESKTAHVLAARRHCMSQHIESAPSLSQRNRPLVAASRAELTRLVLALAQSDLVCPIAKHGALSRVELMSGPDLSKLVRRIALF